MGAFLLVCLGGAVGTGARYLTGLWAVRAFGTGLPWGTLLVNASGSFLMSVIMQVGLGKTAMLSPELRLVLTTGVLGGFTTYSSFNYENLHLIQHGHFGLTVMYMLATLLGCLAAGVLGLLVGRALG